jgi:CheY-like chemotaxis protein
LGLALSKRLTEAMGGTLGVDSVLGEGSAFFVELPLCADPLAEVAIEADQTAAQDATAAGNITYSVLAIEDNPANLRLLERILKNRPDIQLISAIQGSVGLDLSIKQHLDMILLDLNLPDLSGQEVLSQLKANPNTRNVPVLILSADATPSQMEKLKAEGALDYLTKPLDVSAFLQLLEHALPIQK